MSIDRIELARKIKAHRKLAKQVYPSAKINYEWYVHYKNATNLEGIYDRICTDYRGLLSILKEIVYDLKRETLLRACKSIDACINYTGDNEKLSKIIQGIAAVCRAEREGNDEYSEEEVLDNVKFAIQKLKDILEGK